MVNNTIQNRIIFDQEDLQEVSTSRKYPLGYQVQVVDNTDTLAPYASILEYVQAGETLTQYGVYGIQGNASGIVAGLMSSSATAVTLARVCVPQTSIASASYGFVPVKGVCTMAHTAGAGVNMTEGSQFVVADAATVATAQTVSQATGTAPTALRLQNSIAFASGLSGTAANISVYLLGDPVVQAGVEI